MNRRKSQKLLAETKLAQSLHFFDKKSGGIIPSLDLPTTFKRNNQYEAFDKWLYSREGNETTSKPKKLFNASTVARCFYFFFRMSALTTLLDTLQTENQSLQNSIYYAIANYFEEVCLRRGIELSKISVTELYQVDKYIKVEKLN